MRRHLHTAKIIIELRTLTTVAQQITKLNNKKTDSKQITNQFVFNDHKSLRGKQLSELISLCEISQISNKTEKNIFLFSFF